MKPALILSVLLLAGCGSQPAAQASSADEFAARVGAGGSATQAAPAPANGVAGPPPAGSDVRELERLGDISSVDLGMNAGSCTFSANGVALLVAAAPDEPTLPGKATVRVGNQLLLLDAMPGGLDAVRRGTRYSGEGFTAQLARAGGDAANLTITEDEGEARTIAGKWACT